ncbi:MAG: hypothetical protein NT166_03065 [Candidatus Aminicenantes bacterium]|nr:hypothetical protein [Candidatus Aminicenantes bacterium]
MITFKKRNGSEGINEGLSEGINEGINKLFFHIATHPGERLTEISNQLKIPKKTLERWIKELKEQEKIHFKGSKRNGGYYAL